MRFANSGVRVLNLNNAHLGRQPTIAAFTVLTFDQRKIIAILPTTHNRIVLLRSVKISQLLSIPASGIPRAPLYEAHTIPVDHTHIVQASLGNRVEV